MKYICAVFLYTMLCSMSGCQKDNFYEDPNNPGLSLFTSRGYYVTSFYLNGRPWVRSFSSRYGAYDSQVILKKTTSALDTVFISWTGDSRGYIDSFPRDVFTMGIPVKKNFTLADFYAFSSRRLPETGTEVSFFLSNGYDFAMAGQPDADVIQGTGTVYFTGITPSTTDKRSFGMYGLFEGFIAPNVRIEKGRFDYRYDSLSHNLP